MLKKISYLFIIFIISSCSFQPKDNFYSINITPKEVIYFDNKFDGTLLIKKIITEGFIGGQGIVYVDEDGSEAISSNSFWNMPPDLILEKGLIKYLEEAKSFDNIIIREDGLQKADYELYASIEKFEITYKKIDDISVDLSIKFMIRKVSNKEVIFLDRYTKSANILYNDMDLFVGNIERLLNDILSEFTEDIKGRIT